MKIYFKFSIVLFAISCVADTPPDTAQEDPKQRAVQKPDRWSLISKNPIIPLTDSETENRRIQYYQNEDLDQNRRKIYYITSDSYKPFSNSDDKFYLSKPPKPFIKKPIAFNVDTDRFNLGPFSSETSTKKPIKSIIKPLKYESLVKVNDTRVDGNKVHSKPSEAVKRPEWPDLGHFYDKVPNKSKFFEDLGRKYSFFDPNYNNFPTLIVNYLIDVTRAE